MMGLIRGANASRGRPAGNALSGPTRLINHTRRAIGEQCPQNFLMPGKAHVLLFIAVIVLAGAVRAMGPIAGAARGAVVIKQNDLQNDLYFGHVPREVPNCQLYLRRSHESSSK